MSAIAMWKRRVLRLKSRRAESASSSAARLRTLSGMIDKERNAAQVLLLMNTVLFLGGGIRPRNEALEVDFMSAMMEMKSLMEQNSPEVVCAGALVGFYTDTLESGTPAARARSDYPELYAELENKFLSDPCIRSFLSVVADYCKEDGDSAIYDRLISKDAYVSGGSGKECARRSIHNTPKRKGFWQTLFG